MLTDTERFCWCFSQIKWEEEMMLNDYRFHRICSKLSENVSYLYNKQLLIKFQMDSFEERKKIQFRGIFI